MPPIVIPREKRSEYIDLLWDYQNAALVEEARRHNAARLHQ